MNACRVCMETEKDQKFTSMFIDNGKNASRFSLLTGLVVTEMSGADTVLICNYCSIQLELFSLWRERCKSNDTIFRNSSSDVIASELLASNDEKAKAKKSKITSYDEFLTNMENAFDPTNMDENMVTYKNAFKYPFICNSNDSNTSNNMCQSKKCRICDETFATRQKCTMHFKTKHPKLKQYGCKSCKKSFTIEKSFCNHMQKHESSYIPLACSRCNKIFKSKENYFCHVQTHEKELLFKIPFTNEDKESVIRSWNDNCLSKYPLLHPSNLVLNHLLH